MKKLDIFSEDSETRLATTEAKQKQSSKISKTLSSSRLKLHKRILISTCSLALIQESFIQAAECN
jgi:hypothetical protein